MKLTTTQSWHAISSMKNWVQSLQIALLIEIHCVATLGLWPWAQDDLSRNVHGSLLFRRDFWELGFSWMKWWPSLDSASPVFLVFGAGLILALGRSGAVQKRF